MQIGILKVQFAFL